uniref:Uncharacterized protein n=1 Tax=Octactis speculum TaxID=3111310 RepID=A0A6U3R5A4_9STRA
MCLPPMWAHQTNQSVQPAQQLQATQIDQSQQQLFHSFQPAIQYSQMPFVSQFGQNQQQQQQQHQQQQQRAQKQQQQQDMYALQGQIQFQCTFFKTLEQNVASIARRRCEELMRRQEALQLCHSLRPSSSGGGEGDSAGLFSGRSSSSSRGERLSLVDAHVASLRMRDKAQAAHREEASAFRQRGSAHSSLLEYHAAELQEQRMRDRSQRRIASVANSSWRSPFDGLDPAASVGLCALPVSNKDAVSRMQRFVGKYSMNQSPHAMELS